MVSRVSDTETLYIVTTDFNGWQQTRICLQRLQQSTFRNFTTIVVDHGTTDETASGLKEFPSCIRLRGEPDLWWTGATNLGIREALRRGARSIMLLNSDCYVEESTLENLMQHVSTGAPGIVAPIQRDAATGEVLVARMSYCFTLGFATVVLPSMRKIKTSENGLMSTRLIGGGRGVVLPAEVFDSVGFFDERALPHYYADHDFFLRCKAAGLRLYVATDASVLVDDSRTSVARGLSDMSWQQFKDSLGDPRSHRNLGALSELFRRHYPIRWLFPIGVTLNLARYFVSYLLLRASRVLRRPG